MSWADAVVVAVAAAAVVSGLRRGALIELFIWGGLLVGILAGVLLTPVVVRAFGTERPRAIAFVTLVTFSLLIVTIQIAANAAGKVMRRALEPNVARIDRIAGVGVALFFSFVGVWTLGVVFARGPSDAVARAIDESALLRVIDAVAPEPPAALVRIGLLMDEAPFADVFGGLGGAGASQVPPAPASIASTPAVSAAATRVVRIVSKGCGGLLVGAGFAIESGYVITASHVVAGTHGTTVVDQRGVERPGTVVHLDAGQDIAIIRVSGITPMTMTTIAAPRGTAGATIGFPGAGPLRIEPARVRDHRRARGTDIYGDGNATRSVYTLRGLVRNGASGGPFVDADGIVRGLVFGARSVGDEAYALDAATVRAAMDTARGRIAAVPTLRCA